MCESQRDAGTRYTRERGELASDTIALPPPRESLGHISIFFFLEPILIAFIVTDREITRSSTLPGEVQ